MKRSIILVVRLYKSVAPTKSFFKVRPFYASRRRDLSACGIPTSPNCAEQIQILLYISIYIMYTLLLLLLLLLLLQARTDLKYIA